MVLRKIQSYFRSALLITLLFLIASCIFVHSDYGLNITGKVFKKNGEALPNVNVTIKFRKSVFDALTPVNQASVLTDAEGKFRFFYLTDRKSQEYILHFSKEGYRPLEIKSSKISNLNLFIEMEKSKKGLHNESLDSERE